MEIFVRTIANAIEDHWDYVIVIDGREGSGKSSLALHIKAIYDGKYSLDHVLFDAEELLDVMQNAPKRSCVVMDEAIVSLYKRDSLKEFQTLLVKAFAIVRARELFFILVLPNFWDLDQALRTRANHRIYVYARRIEGRLVRGYAKVYKPQRTEWTTKWAWQEIEWEYIFPALPEEFEIIYDEFKTKGLMRSLKKFEKKIEEERKAEEEKAKGIRGTKMRLIVEYIKDNPKAEALEIAREVGVTEGYAKEALRIYGV